MKEEWSKLIKIKAFELGFAACGIAQIEPINETINCLEQWTTDGMHGDMHYMVNNIKVRANPEYLVPHAKSMISLAFNYYTNAKQCDTEAPKIAKYALGKDYHFIIKEQLKQLLDYIQTLNPQITGRVFTDSAPIMERFWAAKSGIGWQGKNTNLIIPRKGSFYFLAELVLDCELVYDQPIQNRCGSCTRCIDACPTGALLKPYTLDARKCISYLTIENKGSIPEKYHKQMNNYMYGCDICQDVCPWNKFAEEHTNDDLKANPILLTTKKEEWEHLDECAFQDRFKKSAVKRTKFAGLRRNIDFLLQINSDNASNPHISEDS